MPRIWLTAPVLASLQALATAGDSRWLALKARADVDPASGDTGILSYALAYQVSGNTAYAARAITLMQAYVDGGMGEITFDSGYNARSLLLEMAVGWDWCKDQLTSGQLTSFPAQMEAWTDWVWPETNPARAGAWAINDPGNNYFHGFMMTWFTGLALLGVSAKAQGYLDLARSKFLNMVKPHLANEGAGGYDMEGTNYGSGTRFRIFYYLSAHFTAQGEDLLNAPGFLWPQQAVLATIALTTPQRDRIYPGGDQARVSDAPLSDYDRIALLAATAYLPAPVKGYAQWWLGHVNPSLNLWSFTRWAEFLWYQHGLAPVDYTLSLDTALDAPGAGLLADRSGWGTGDVMVTLQCGPTEQSHQDRAQNAFLIFQGDWLAACAKLTSHSGEYQQGSLNNCLTMGGQEQGFWQTTAQVLQFAHNAEYTLMVGEAAPAYNISVQTLYSWRRTLFFLKPNLVVVHDTVDAVDAGQAKVWHLNTLNQPMLAGNGYQAPAGAYQLFGTSLLPAGAVLSSTGIYLGGPGDDQLSSWRIDSAAPTGSHLDTFLNVLEAAPTAQGAATAVTGLVTGRATLAGVQIGSRVVVFDAADAVLPISYSADTTAGTTHFIVTRLPLQAFQVSVSSGPSLTLTADSHGMIRFTLAGGGGPAAPVMVQVTPAPRSLCPWLPLLGARHHGRLTDRSGSLAAGRAAQPLCAAHPKRAYLLVQNTSLGDLWLDFTVPAVMGWPSLRLPPGAVLTYEGGWVPTDALTIIGATAGQTYSAKEG